MALRNVPFRSEVLTWDPDSLADYFKKLNYKDCEKAVKKYLIDGPRFLNLTENDIQKFPKLRMPILTKLSQEINKNEERRSFFARKPQVQRFPEDIENHEEDNGGWSSFEEEEDDYESPNEDQEEEGDGDYESPIEEEVSGPAEDDADYEPPPSNDEESMQNSILPAKPLPNSEYIDRPHPGNAQQQPPVPPQRPKLIISPQPNQEPSRSRNQKTAKIPAPSIDRSTKPPLDRSLAPFDRKPFTPGKKPEKLSAPAGRHFGELLPKIQKPPLPPTTERHERSIHTGKKPPVPRHGWGLDRRENDEDDVHQRPLPQQALPPVSSNTFPSRPPKPGSLPAPHHPGAFLESNSNFSQSASLPPYFPQGSNSRMQHRANGRNLSLPASGVTRPPSPGEEENLSNEEWYVSYVTRTEAEAALRKINQDGTFLVRDSSKKTITNPYVLMVLYKDKVYNIQIRYQEESQVYVLGTGLRGKEDFLSVSDIIDYFRKMPLLLIDGKNRGSRYQCTLTHSAVCP